MSVPFGILIWGMSGGQEAIVDKTRGMRCSGMRTGIQRDARIYVPGPSSSRPRIEPPPKGGDKNGPEARSGHVLGRAVSGSHVSDMRDDL